MTRLVAERVRFNFEGLSGPISEWIEGMFGPLDAAPQVKAPTEITFRFVDRVATEGGRLWPLPAGHAPDGSMWFADHLGRAAAMTFPLSESEILVDRSIDPWFFQRWIYMPLLKASLWQHGVSLVHAAGVSIDGRCIAISGWAGAGKSPVVLKLLADGANLISDDWMALSEDGTAYPISAQLNLNSWHRPHIDPARWPGSDSKKLHRLKRVAQAAARFTASYPKLSMAFARLADIASSAGKIKVPITRVFPEVGMARPSRLEGLFFIPRKGTFEPTAAALPEVIAASSRSELLYCDDFEQAIRYSYPGLLDQPLFGSGIEEGAVMAAGFFHAHSEVVHCDGSPADVDRLCSHITKMVSDSPKAAVA